MMMMMMIGRGGTQLDAGSELQGALLFLTFSNIPDCMPQFYGLSSECPARESSAVPECYQVPQLLHVRCAMECIVNPDNVNTINA
jgi:hypothetical protein